MGEQENVSSASYSHLPCVITLEICGTLASAKPPRSSGLPLRLPYLFHFESDTPTLTPSYPRSTGLQHEKPQGGRARIRERARLCAVAAVQPFGRREICL